MSMVIGTNVASLTAQRHLETSRADLEQSMERLSSGKRINSAMDDAAGLAIRDRMTSQVNGLNQAVRNAGDAISLGQTAEGALDESTSILQRMRDLSVQSVNGTNSTQDRTALQSEVTQLQAELTRIATSSKFNGKTVLDGTFTSQTFQIGQLGGDTVDLSISDMKATALGAKGTVVAANEVTAVPATGTMKFTAAAADGNTTTAVIGSATLAVTFKTADIGGTPTVNTTATAFAAAWNASIDTNVSKYTASVSTDTVTFTEDTATTGALSVASSGGPAATDASVTTGVAAVAAVEGTSSQAAVSAADISTAAGATSAIASIDTAIESVGAERAKLGAFQNRLAHTVSNLQSMIENTGAAQSRIEDADFATESANLAKNQVLQQAGTAMLSQANASTQNVLSLLK